MLSVSITNTLRSGTLANPRPAVPGSSRFKQGSGAARRVIAASTITDADAAAAPWAQPGYRGAYLSKQPLSIQTAAFVGTAVMLAVDTYYAYSTLGPWLCAQFAFCRAYMKNAPFIIGALYAVVGILHFTAHKAIARMYPPQGTWGIWWLPGSPSWHVNWTGAAEFLGGTGLLLAALKVAGLPAWLGSASALGLALLTWVVTPANFYMFSHNCPGPFPELFIPPVTHIVRFSMQVLLLATLLGLGMPGLLAALA